MSRKERIGKSVELCQDLLRRLQVVLVTLGEDGVLLARRGSHHEPLPLENDDEVSGKFKISPKLSVIGIAVPSQCNARWRISYVLCPVSHNNPCNNLYFLSNETYTVMSNPEVSCYL